MPDTASLGTAQDADSVQLPQSMRPVVVSLRHAGWFCGRAADGLTLATLRAPSPP